MAEDIDRFIQEQKSKLARERNDLQQENTRKVMEPAPNDYSAAGRNGFKENIPQSGPAPSTGKGNAVPSGSHDNLKDKLARERREEYQRFLAEKDLRSAPRKQEDIPDRGGSLMIPSRDSAKERARKARNKEYNDFLKNKGGNVSRKPRIGNEELSPDINKRPSYNPITGNETTKESPPQNPPQNGHPPPHNGHRNEPQDRGVDQWQIRREAASQTPRPILKEYDDRPPPGPRRGWGTPQPDYDELLRRKREEEARYRRYDDDYDYYPPRGGMRPSYSDSHLNRYPEDGRYSRARNDYYDQEYDKRRVRFTDDKPSTNDRAYPLPSNMRYDRPPMDRPAQEGRDLVNEQVYDWGISRGGRSRTLPEMERPAGNRGYDAVDNKQPRAKSATLATEEIGMAIGNRDTASAIRRKKEQYRLELEQQMKETQDAKKREKQEGLRINASGALDPAKKPEGLGGFGTSRVSSRTPVPSQQPAAAPQGYQPSFLNQPYANAQMGGAQPQVPNLGLEEALAKSHMGGVGFREEAPMIERPFSLNNYHSVLAAAPTALTDPYMYYGIRNPMDPEPDAVKTSRTWIDSMSRSLSRAGGGFAPQILQQPMSFNTMYPSQQYGAFPAARPGAAAGGVPLTNAPQENLSLLGAAQTAQIRNEGSIKNFVGDTSPRTVNDPKSYQAILKQQMMEKDQKKRLEKEERERYEAKLDAEAANYNPWGKGGAGAPMRDNKGKIVADLRKLHNHNEQTLKDPQTTQLQLYSEQSPMATTTSPGYPGLPDKSPQPGAVAVKHDDQQPVTTGSKNPQDEYKEFLRQQVEDKKRREAELKEKIRMEEEREAPRHEQREKMQRDFEEEQQRQRIKEEEKKKLKEELERKIEEEKQEADKKKHDVIEAKRRQAEEARQKQQDQVPSNNDQKDRYSPPIPTLRTKQDEPRQSSPPIPTLRKNKEEAKKELSKQPKDVHGMPRRPPGTQRDMDARPIIPAKGDIYSRPFSKEKPSASDHPQSNDNISSPWRELSADQSPTNTPKEELTQKKEDPIGNPWEYSQGPTGKTSEDRARIFPPKDVPEKHAKLEALDKFRLPRESPPDSPLPRVIPRENAALSPMEKLHTHKTKEENEVDGGQGKEVEETQDKVQENPRKANEFDLVDWMRSIDPDLVVYAPSLAENGYKTLKTVRRLNRHTLLQFCPDMKHGHYEAVLHEVDRIQTPISRKLLEEERMRNNENLPEDSFTDFLSDVSKEPAPTKLNWQEQEDNAKGHDGVGGVGRDPCDVMQALSAMRRQLHSEQRRIQSQLDRNKEHNPYSQPQPKPSSRRASPQVDIFEVARHKAPVTVRREPLTHHAAAADFSHLKNRESDSRQRLREQFPNNPNSDLTLEAQQRALLRHQQEKLDNLRRGKSKRPLEDQMPSMDPRDLGRSDSPLLALESESAFIGINNGVTDIPSTPPHRKRAPFPRKEYGELSTSVANRNKPKDPLGSTMSFDNDTIDFLAKKNEERNKALRNLEADNDSLVDADDVLTRFMMRSSHDRPKSGKSEDLSLWLQPSTIE